MIRPRCCRSSGTCAMPRARLDCPSARRPLRLIPIPLILTFPVAAVIPPSTWRSSDWPFPATPAIPRISPERTLNETSLKRRTPSASVTLRLSTSRTASPGSACFLSMRSRTFRPTINSASRSGLVPAVGRVATISPPRMTLTASVISIISRSLWVMRMIVLPWRLSPSRMRNR